MIVVADSSPITALLHLKKLDLLTTLYGQIFIPHSVASELATLQNFGFDLSFLLQTDKFIIRRAADENFVQRLCEVLDKGEAEGIALAKEIKADLLLIDEKLGKELAEAEHITCKGVVGVLIEAKHRGLIFLLKPLLDDLIINLKFRLSENIYMLALRKAGE